jgi:hypothetical protein
VSRTVIVTPFGRPDQLAAACVLSEIEGDVVPLGDFSAIVQHGTDIAAGNRAAAAISKLTGKHEVLLMVRSEEQIDAAHSRCRTCPMTWSASCWRSPTPATSRAGSTPRRCRSWTPPGRP